MLMIFLEAAEMNSSSKKHQISCDVTIGPHLHRTDEQFPDAFPVITITYCTNFAYMSNILLYDLGSFENFQKS